MSAYSAVSTAYKLEKITNLHVSSHFVHWKDEKSQWDIPGWLGTDLSGEQEKEIPGQRPSLRGYPNGSMVKDMGLLSIHNLYPCLFLFFWPTVGQVLVCESAIFWYFLPLLHSQSSDSVPSFNASLNSPRPPAQPCLALQAASLHAQFPIESSFRTLQCPLSCSSGRSNPSWVAPPQ